MFVWEELFQSRYTQDFITAIGVTHINWSLSRLWASHYKQYLPSVRYLQVCYSQGLLYVFFHLLNLQTACNTKSRCQCNTTASAVSCWDAHCPWCSCKAYRKLRALRLKSWHLTLKYLSTDAVKVLLITVLSSFIALLVTRSLLKNVKPFVSCLPWQRCMANYCFW